MPTSLFIERVDHLSRVYELWEEFEADDSLMNDRREYDVEDLLKAYHLTHEQAFYLHWLIRLENDKDFETLYSWADHSKRMEGSTAERYKDRILRLECLEETITESMHQNFDGYSEGEKVIIQGYLMDLGIAVNLTYKDYKKERYGYSAPGKRSEKKADE